MQRVGRFGLAAIRVTVTSSADGDGRGLRNRLVGQWDGVDGAFEQSTDGRRIGSGSQEDENFDKQALDPPPIKGGGA